MGRWSASLALHIAYGYETELDENDELVSAVWEAVRQFALLHQPGEFLVDMIPALKYIPDWFPGASFKKKALYYRQTLQCMIDLPFDRVEQQVVRTPGMVVLDAPFIDAHSCAPESWNREAILHG